MPSEEVEITNIESNDTNQNIIDVVTLSEDLDDESITGQSVGDTSGQESRCEENNDLQLEVSEDKS